MRALELLQVTWSITWLILKCYRRQPPRFLVYDVIWAFTYVSIIRDTTIGVLWIWIMCWTYHFVRGRHKQWFPTTDCHRICRWGCFMNLWSWYSLKVETLSICSYLTEEIEIHRFSWTWFYRFFVGPRPSKTASEDPKRAPRGYLVRSGVCLRT